MHYSGIDGTLRTNLVRNYMENWVLQQGNSAHCNLQRQNSHSGEHTVPISLILTDEMFNMKFSFNSLSGVTHICVSELAIIVSDNGLSPSRRQAIIWTNAGILLIGPLGTNFSDIAIEIDIFSFKKMHLKMSSGNWQPSCLGLNVLKWIRNKKMISAYCHWLPIPCASETHNILLVVRSHTIFNPFKPCFLKNDFKSSRKLICIYWWMWDHSNDNPLQSTRIFQQYARQIFLGIVYSLHSTQSDYLSTA